ncbi:response regulator [candidate division KSB3 bacterium]|uniref:Response regulator n=1 Tax=candidate division KSB3 bacterium TaxID=2044937 RepID=A0A9D5JX85_9BACT|nr:response regulator [candidate division KSB3 bacterium]MBD3325626.1 response regulator [candidate division KSB3 bacterium]
MENKRILVVDDEENMRYMLQLTLEDEGYEVELASNGAEGIEKVHAEHFDFVICDIRMPKANGLEVLASVTESSPHTPVIMISAFGTLDTAIQAMKEGAYDYVSKPFKQDEILLTLKKAEERERLRIENQFLRQEVEKKYRFENIIGKSPQMQEIFRRIEKITNYKTTVLITGESGTGKELVAKAIHYAGNRKHGPFIAINCGAIPDELLESELFGHVKGAFTGAVHHNPGLILQANQGTLFLDEIGELPLHLQVKLLRFLQESEIRRVGDTRTTNVDVRVLAATSRNMATEVEKGTFREDLYYRLNVVPLHIPPLRERREDIALLIQHFLKKYTQEMGKPIERIANDAMKALLDYGWKGNVRELENVLERAIVMTEGDTITTEYLPDELLELHSQITLKIPESRIVLKDVLKEITQMTEKTMIARALAQTEDNRTHAAKLLQISHRALMYKLKEYDL